MDFTTDENPTISAVILVYASLVFVALEPTTGRQLIQEYAEQLWALAEAVRGVLIIKPCTCPTIHQRAI